MIDPFLIEKTTEEFDAIVVGSGISGGWAAKELCEKGLKVLMIERGEPVRHQKDYIGEGVPPWAWPNRGEVDYELVADQQPIQRLCYAYNDATKHFFGNDRDMAYQTPKESGFRWIRGNSLGGRSLLWHRQSYRLGKYDFDSHRYDGLGADWPVRYEDMAPWYSYVERFAGISGEKLGLDVVPDSEFLPPFEMNAVEKWAKKRYTKIYKDRHFTMGRTAHLKEATQFFMDQGRYKCMARNECQKGCSFGAYFSTLSSTLPAAIKTNNLKIACNSVVESLEYDDATNRVTGVNVVDNETLETREYRGKMVFLCASTIGTTQIMLNSKSSAFPDGLGNSSGVLGHYLMDHIYNSGAFGQIDGFEKDYYKGRRPTGILIPRYVNLGKKDRDFDRGFALVGGAGRGGWDRGQYNDDFGADFKTSLSQPGGWGMTLHGSGEMLPRYENHLRLHETETDKWGIPKLIIDCRWGENDYKLMDAIAEDCTEALERLGAKNISTKKNDDPPGFAIHEMGTARMGDDPTTSVLNGRNQAHDVPNLFVTDGASMVSSGWQNPSLTYMALSARAANFAVDMYKNKEI